MSLESVYREFLKAPSSRLLSSDVSLAYVPSGVSVHGSVDVLKQIEHDSGRATRDDSRTVSSISTTDTLSLETLSVIRFEYGGGSYTPGLNASHITAQAVLLPFIHIVQFTEDRLIKAVRLYWDQGALLRDIGVISIQGTGWPISSSRKQAETVAELTKTPEPEPERPRHRSQSPTKRIGRDLGELLLGDAQLPDNGEKKAPRLTSTNQPSWSFEDFSTPQKNPKPKVRQGQNPTFAWDPEDEVNQTPARKLGPGRNGTCAQFDITDTSQTPARPRPVDHRSLYHDPLEVGPTPAKKAPSNAAHIKMLESSFEISDDSPREKANAGSNAGPAAKPANKKFNQSMLASWDHGDDDGYVMEKPSVKAMGDGFGGRKGDEGRSRIFGDENTDEEEEAPKSRPKPKSATGGRMNQQASSFWDDFY